MARTIVSPVQVSEQLRPQAEPVDTYVRPPDPAPSQLHELAGALENFSQNLSSFAAKHQADQKAADDVRGKAAAYKENGLGYAEAVRRGDIPAYADDNFIKSYKHGQGEILGKQLASKFSTEYQGWGGRNDTDQASFDNFLGDFIKNNLNTDDPDVLAGAMPYVTQLTETAYTINNTDRNNALKGKALDTSIANSAMNIDAADDHGIASGKGTDYNQLWDQLLTDRQKALDVGQVQADYDKNFYQMIANKAIEKQDPQLLQLLDRNLPGEDHPYSATPDGMRLKSETERTLLTAGAEQQRLAAQAQKEADAKQKDANTAFVVENLMKDPNAQFDGDWLKKASVLDPTLEVDIANWRKTAAEGAPEDQGTLLHIEAAIMAKQYGVDDLMKDMGTNGGPIHSIETATKLRTLINSVNDDAMKPLLTNDAYKFGMEQIDKLTTPGPDSTWESDPGQMNLAGAAAKLDYQKAMVSWFAANPNASYSDISTQSDIVLGRIQKGMHPETGTYDTPQGLAGQKPSGAVDANGRPAPDTGVPANPLTQPQQALDNAAAAQPQPNPELDPWHSDHPPKYADLPQQTQLKITQRAEALGVSPEDYIATVYANLKQDDLRAKTVDGQDVASQKPTADGAAFSPQDKVQLKAVGPSHPGTADNNYDTVLTGKDEEAFQAWKQKYAPNDNGNDYDYRGAFAAGVTPDPKTGHWPDTFKKPNEPTFSDQSQYAPLAPDEAGTWNGDTYVPNPKATMPHNPADEQVNYAEQPATATNPALGAISSATEGDAMKVWGGSAPPSMDALNDDQKKSVTQAAGELDMPVEDYISNLYYRLRADKQGNNMTTPAAAGATGLANLVGKTEGTDKGKGYDEVIGYGKFGGHEHPVSTLTLAGVQMLQRKLVSNGAPSSAVGRYQIINKTLRRLIVNMHLKATDVFTPELQDRMFVELLRERGLDRWKAGAMSDDQFADALSKEWASLPNASGKSAYGQGVGTTRSNLLAVLNSARSA